ncbi:MAG: CHAT domain-containing protein [Bryobacteraceae bacterium]
MKLVLALCLVSAGCNRHSGPSPEVEFERANAAFRRGDLAQARDEAHSAAQRYPATSSYHWRFRLLEAEALLYKGERQAAAAILAEHPPDGDAFFQVDARRDMLQGYMLTRGSQAEAAKLLNEAHRKASSHGFSGLLGEIEVLQGMGMVAAGHPDEARLLFLSARERAVQQHDPYHEAISLLDLGMLSKSKSRFDEALGWFEQALARARVSGSGTLIAAVLNNAAMCHTQLGNFAEANKRRQEAVERLGSSEVKAVRRDIFGEMGRTYSGQGDQLKAIECYRQALAIAREFPGSEEVRRLNNNLSAALAAAGNWEAAEQANLKELSLAKDARATGYASLNSAVIAAGRGRMDEAIANYRKAMQAAPGEPAVLWQSHAGLGQTYAQMGKKPLAREEFETALQVIEQNRAELSRDDYKITFLSRLIHFYQEYVEALVASGATEKALEVADSSRARILMEKLSLTPAPRSRSASYQSFAKRSGSVLLFYWLAPTNSYLWVVSAAKVKCFPLPPAAEIQALVQQYRAFLEDGVRDPLQTESAAGARLFQILIAPAAGLIPAGSRIVLVPDGPLHLLNFETLPVYGAKAHYWIEDATVTIAPSLGLLAAAAPEKPVLPASLLIIGDPLYAGTPYPPLQFASTEINKLRGRFPAAKKTFLSKADATPDSYRGADPQQFSLIHFSAHADVNAGSPLDSAIILSPKAARFKLYTRDIMEQPLHADLVTISACKSAGSRAYAGEGIVGLAWSFLRSGARSVIAGLWDVDDSSSAGMMDGLYGAIESGQSPVDALRTAKLAMIHSEGAYRKPYYWAPFQVYTR